MKLAQIKEASYHGQQTWGIHVLIGDEDRTVGPFSSEEAARSYIAQIKTAAGDNARSHSEWYDDKNFDLYDVPLKMMSPEDLTRYLDL